MDKLRQKRKDKRVAELLAQQRAALLTRKRALAALLNKEMNGWQAEMLTEKKSPADRLRTLQDRAIALRDAREAERRKFVDKMYHEQWQASCDDGRLLDSKATIKHVVGERDEDSRRALGLHRYRSAWMPARRLRTTVVASLAKVG